MGSILIKNEADGKQCKLAYNRSALVRMEKQGFNVQKIEEEPLSNICLLIRGAFYMHNPSLSDEEIDAIAEQIDGGEKFIQALLKLYSDVLMSLSGQKSSKEPKNFKWEMN